MAFRLTPEDLDVLATIAEYRILGVRHISALHQRNPAAFRRRLRRIEDEGLIRIATQGYQQGLGRPESLVSLSEKGADLLRGNRLIDADVPTDRITADKIRCLEHHLLINEFRVQLMQIDRIVPSLSVHFLSTFSPKLYRSSKDRPLIHERFRPREDSDECVEFTPDGVFAITHMEASRTVLLFLEVDMDTETVASPQPCSTDVRQKVVVYKALFRSERYRRYEQMWNCRFRGFRLLFLTCNISRMATLCRLICEMQPSDFIWLTDQQSLTSQGVGAPIWAPAGLIDTPRKSILGSCAPTAAPLPAEVT